jgi:hypothetical protein
MKRRNDVFGFESDERLAQRRKIDVAEEKPAFSALRRPAAAAPPAPGGGGGHAQARDDAMILTDDIADSMRHRGTIHSTGRGQPNTKQSLVVQTVVVKANQYEARARNLPTDTICPLGSRQAFSCKQGELAFGVDRETSANQAPRTGFQGFGDTEIVTCVNGLNKGARLFCVGPLNGDKDAKDVQMDPAVSATIAGGDTIINTGPLVIKAHSGFGFMTTPFTVMGEDGVMRPAIKQVGLPDDKFRPMTVPMDDLMSPTVAEKCIDVAAAIVARAGAPSLDEFKEEWRQGRRKFRNVVIDYQLGAETRMSSDDYLPLDLYFGWVLYSLLFNQGSNAEIFNLLEKVQSQQANFASTSPWLPQAQPQLATSFTTAGARDAHVERRKAQCLVNHASWVKRHYIGKAMKTAPPGQPLDALFGYA